MLVGYHLPSGLPLEQSLVMHSEIPNRNCHRALLLCRLSPTELTPKSGVCFDCTRRAFAACRSSSETLHRAVHDPATAIGTRALSVCRYDCICRPCHNILGICRSRQHSRWRCVAGYVYQDAYGRTLTPSSRTPDPVNSLNNVRIISLDPTTTIGPTFQRGRWLHRLICKDENP